MKRIVALLAVLALTFFIAGCGGRDASFGYIDIQKVLQESPKAKELRTQLETKVQEMKVTEEKDRAELKDEELTQKQQANVAAMQAYTQQLDEQFRAVLNTAMDEVAKEKGLGAVLVKDSVLQGGTDVTDEVINRLK